MPPRIRRQQVNVITDSGAMCNSLGLEVLHKLGMSRKDLVRVQGNWSAIDGNQIVVLGAVFLRLKGLDKISGGVVESAVMAVVTDSTRDFWIGQQTMKNLGIITTDFPQVKVSGSNAAVAGVLMEQDTCDCPPRQQPPKRPDQLPFEPCEGNISSMKQWLLEKFAMSTFNKCTHQRLPMMGLSASENSCEA